MKTQKQYNKEKTRILNKKNVSDMEKSEMLTNNWFEYIFNYDQKRQKLSIKYQSEMIRIHI